MNYKQVVIILKYLIYQKKLLVSIKTVLFSLVFLFGGTINGITQPIDITGLKNIYTQTQNEKTAINLSTGFLAIAQWYTQMPQYNADSVRFYFASAKDLLVKHQSEYELLKVYREALRTFNIYTPAQIDSMAVEAWKYIEPKLKVSTNHFLYYDILYHWALATNQIGDRARALELYSKAYELVKNEKEPYVLAGLLADRGNIYLNFGNSYEDVGYPYVKQSIALYEQSAIQKDLKKLYQNYSHMAWRHNTLDQFDTCMIYFGKEKELLQSIKDPMVHFEYLTNYGNVLARMGKKAESKICLLLGDELRNKYQMNMNSINRFNLSLLGVLYTAEKNYEKALDYFKQSHTIFKIMSPLGFDPDNMENIALALEEKGDYKQALEYRKLYMEENAKYLNSLNSKTVREQELQADLLLQEKDLDRKKRERNLLFFSLLITLVLSGFLTMFYRRSEKNKKILELQNETIKVQANTLRQHDINKTRFFTNVSHELRTPLTLMLGPINSVLNSNTLSDRNKSILTLAKENAKQLLTLVNEILDITKAETVKMTVQNEATQVYSFFKRLVSNFESYASQRKVKLFFSIDPRMPHNIMMDTGKLERIFNNLLTNALKFTAANGSITVKIADESTQWSLIIEDTGRGIHPDDLQHVFDRFYQGSQQHMSMEGGTGIGLSLSKDLAQVMQGTLTVESVLGKGSTFKLTLPKIEVLGDESKLEWVETVPNREASVDNYTNKIEKQNTFINIPGENKRLVPKILVAEDNHSLRDYLSIILSEYYIVIAVTNGSEALTYLEENQASGPDLIITDIMMPVMDGFVLLEKLKSNSILQRIPVIMLTARIGNEDKLKALRIGVDDYLTKPFEEEELLARIKNLLANAQMRIQVRNEVEISKEDILFSNSQEDIEWLRKLESESILHVADSNFTMDILADRMHISRAQFFRRVQLLTGMTPLQYIQTIKYNHARNLLEQKKVNSVKAAAIAVGVTKVQYFSEQFKERFGKSPSEYLG